MENQTDRWAKEAFMAATKETFGFSMADIEQIILNSTNIKERNGLVVYFEGFLGLEGSLQFVDELIKRKAGKETPVVKGVWKSNSLNVAQLIQQQLAISEAEAQSTIDHLKTFPSDQERREYLENIIGKCFEAERILILLSKLIKKEQDDQNLAEQSRKEKKSKKKKANEKEKIAEKVGNKSWCECMATVHELLQNCLQCGKIICAIEGDQKCPFCGKVPDKDVEILPGYEESVKRMQRLIDYQTNSAARTHVHDNAADFDIGADEYNKWISAEERAIALKKRQDMERAEDEAKSRRVITLDLENNRVLMETPLAANKEVASKSNVEQAIAAGNKPCGVFRNPNLKNRVATFASTVERKNPLVKIDWDLSRLQDDER